MVLFSIFISAGIAAMPQKVMAKSYKISSSCEMSSRKCKCKYKNGKDFRTKGWVNIVDKKSGTDLRHSTTAVVSDYYHPNNHYGKVRVVGYGKVSATSKYVHGYSYGQIFWSWVK